MKTNFRMKKIALGVSMASCAMMSGQALAGSWGSPTMGDSQSLEGWGATVEAAANDPRGLGTVTPDSNGLGPYRVPVSHTPTGQLYSVPWTEADPTKTMTGGIEIGGQFTNGDGQTGSNKANEYEDLSDGLYIKHFNFSSNSGQTYLDIFGGNVARTDQYYNAQFGAYNDFKFRAFFDESDHVYSNTAKDIYTGLGTGQEFLVPALQFTGTPSGLAATTSGIGLTNTAAGALQTNIPGVFHSVQSVVAGMADSTLDQDRKKGGLRFDQQLGDNMNVFVSYTLEKRKGAMPYGTSGGGFPGGSQAVGIASASGVFNDNLTGGNANPLCAVIPATTAGCNGYTGTAINTSVNGNGLPTEVPYPIDFTTHELLAGFGWSDELNSLNVTLHGSMFNDAIKDVVFQDPFDSPAGGPAFGLGAVENNATENRNFMNFSTFPDNQQYDAKVDYQRLFPQFWNAAWNTTVSMGQQRQDDNLFPGDVATGFTGNVTSGPGQAPSGTVGTNTINLAYFNSLYVNTVTGQPCTSATQSPACMPTLSRQTADLHNNIDLFSTQLTLHPTDQWSVNGKWKWYDEIHNNTYIAYNPACAANPVGCGVGPWGYVVEDGFGGADDFGTNAGATPGSTAASGIQCVNAAGANNCANNDNNRIQSFNPSWRDVVTSLGTDYQIDPKDSASANFEREDVNRTNRERDWTFEDKLKLGFVSKAITDGTFRGSAEYDHKTGTNYNNYYSVMTADCPDAAMNIANWWECLPPTTNSTGAPIGNVVNGFGGIGTGQGGDGAIDNSVDGAKLDLANRNRYTLIGRFNYMLTSTLDGMITAKDDKMMYPMDPFGYGREARQDLGVTAELNWQISTVTNAYIYDTWQYMHQTQDSVSAGTSGCTYGLLDAGQCTDVPEIYGSGIEAINQAFYYDTRDNNNMFGVGFGHLFDNKQKLDLSAQYEKTSTSILYEGRQAGNCAGGPANIGGSFLTAQDLAEYGCPNVPIGEFIQGEGFAVNSLQLPDEVWNKETLTAKYTIPLTANTALSFTYKFDDAQEADWHYDGLCAYANTPGDRYYLSCNPSNGFKNQTIGAWLAWKL